jgi:hypothetical protein
LERENDELKKQHQSWLGTQSKESDEWVKERNELKEKAHQLDLKLKRQIDAGEALENRLKKELENKGIQIAELKGQIQ